MQEPCTKLKIALMGVYPIVNEIVISAGAAKLVTTQGSILILKLTTALVAAG